MKIGRNDPCPCGSGKRYKKCCLNKSAGYGPCDGPGSGPNGRCGQPSCGAGECKICGKRYAHCHSHREVVQTMLRGHLMRVHPESIPADKFDELLADEAQMNHLYEQRLLAPDLWKRFFEYVEERRQGKPAAVHETSEIAKVVQVLWKEAKKSTFFKGAEHRLDGYKVILSYGDPKEMEKINEKAVEIAKQYNAPGMPDSTPSAPDPNLAHWHLSVSWRRPGAPTAIAVKMLQELVVALGVPEDKREGIQPTYTTRPDGTRNPQVTHWMWTEKNFDA